MKFQFVQKLSKEAGCENLQAGRPDLLHSIKKILKSGVETSRLEPVISKGFPILPDRRLYFFIISAK